MRNVALALSLVLSVFWTLSPVALPSAEAAPARKARVDRRHVDLTEQPAGQLALPGPTEGRHVFFAESASPHRAGVVGVTWPAGGEPERVYVREVTNAKRGPWQEIPADAPNTAEGGNATGGTEPFVVVGTSSVEVAVVSAEPMEASLSVFASPETAIATEASSTRVAAAAAPGSAWDNPQIASRASWGADESLVRNPYTYAKVTGAMIHHTAGSNTYTQADVPAILRSIQAYHVNGRGWNDIAYNFLVDKYGKAWEGRGGGVDKAVQGGHAYGVTNARTTGISLMGNYQTASPSAAMLDTAQRVVAWKFALHGVDPYGTTYGSGGQDGGSTFLNAISGHRDENATDCPGQYVYAQMGTFRSKVASYIPQYKTTPPATAPVANAGPDRSVTTGTTVTLDASGSTSGSTFAWAQTAGTTVTLSNTTAAKPTFTPTKAGSYTFRVTATRNGLSATDHVTITATDPATPGTSNVARAAGVTVTASAEDAADGSLATAAIDGVVSGYPTDATKEWTALNGGANSWIELRFPSAVTVDRVVLHDRINTNDHVQGGRLTFSDGSTVTVGALDNAGAATTVTFAARTTTSIRFTATAVAATTENVGLAEFEAWGTTATAAATTPPAPPPSAAASNLARATGVQATASSQATNQGAAKAIDGSPLGYPTDSTREWATVQGKAGSWIELTFPTPVTLTKVVLNDRPNANDRITGGTLTFSDGSQVPVAGLNNDGAATTITFTGRTVTKVRLTISSVASTTENVGLAEFEAWGVTN